MLLQIVMKKTYHFLILFLILNASTLFAQGPSPFSLHVQEAIKINKERLSLYAKLSKGKSVKVSLSLIAMEEALLPLARILDLRAHHFMKNGVPLLEREIVPMTLPPFETALTPLSLTPVSIDHSDMIGQLQLALKEEDYDELYSIADTAVEELNRAPKTNCLTRHFMESIRRAAHYAPFHILKAKEQQLRTPKNIIRDFVRLHFLGLRWAKLIDAMALETQEMGIPIICQDVPEIAAQD